LGLDVEILASKGILQYLFLHRHARNVVRVRDSPLEVGV